MQATVRVKAVVQDCGASGGLGITLLAVLMLSDKMMLKGFGPGAGKGSVRVCVCMGGGGAGVM
jgi:hypothetical protein